MKPALKPERCVAAFDFDRTITTRDTLIPFLSYVTPCPQTFYRGMTLIPMAIGYKIGLVSNNSAKETALTAFLRKRSKADLVKQGELFSQQIIPKFIRPQALQRIKWHQQMGHHCVLVSAGLELYLTPWAKQIGFDTLICTQLISDSAGNITGKINGINCYGEEKVRRLLATVGPKEQFTLYAYGDSRGDQELLALADYPFYRTMPPAGDNT